jgi:hypothetical protein
MNNLVNSKITLVVPATAVGTTSIVGTTLDMSGFEGVEFILLAGTLTDGVAAVKAGSGALANGSDAQDLAGTSTSLPNTDDGDVAALDLYRPLDRFVTPTVVRGGSTGGVINGVIAIQYGAHVKPTTQDATTVPVSKTVISPVYGTA